MLKLPAELTVESFLARHWQKEPVFINGATERLRPSVSRNELAWLATLDDVESRIIFTERDGEKLRYRAETGPFDPEFLQELPPRDWTLLVHDVEKHLPEMRKLFALVPFIPDWRIDDLMVSFAAPGGGVGPHVDNYDVFLCQGIGKRDWRVETSPLESDLSLSNDLALTREFEGTRYTATQGDILYLPPGVAHWGTAQRACITYSIGMRAPQLADLLAELPDVESTNPFYNDPDLDKNEAIPGYISPQAIHRAEQQLGADAEALGKFVTETKDWITPDSPDTADVEHALDTLKSGGQLEVHGMARIAWDESRIYVNGRSRRPGPTGFNYFQKVCELRKVGGPLPDDTELRNDVEWMLRSGMFEIDGKM